jgi:hypothetical protein
VAGSYQDRQLRACEAVDTRSVLIPADWDTLDDRHMCSIASQILGHPVRAKRSARAIIAAELKRRN